MLALAPDKDLAVSLLPCDRTVPASGAARPFGFARLCSHLCHCWRRLL